MVWLWSGCGVVTPQPHTTPNPHYLKWLWFGCGVTTPHPLHNQTTATLKVYFNELFFISSNERLMYKFYKNCNYFIFLRKAVFIKRTVVSIFCVKNRTTINWYYFHFLSSYAFTIINNVIMREENSSSYRT